MDHGQRQDGLGDSAVAQRQLDAGAARPGRRRGAADHAIRRIPHETGRQAVELETLKQRLRVVRDDGRARVDGGADQKLGGHGRVCHAVKRSDDANSHFGLGGSVTVLGRDNERELAEAMMYSADDTRNWVESQPCRGAA